MGGSLGLLETVAPDHGPVRSAQDASQAFGDIDTTKVDVGKLTAKILKAQQPIPVHEARVLHSIRNSHNCYVRVLVWDPFRDLLISAGGDGWIRLWSTEDLRYIGELDAQLSVRSLLVLTRELVSGHSNGEVIVWSMEQSGWPRAQTLRAHHEAVYALALLSSGDLVTGAEDIRIFSRSNMWGTFYLAGTVVGEVLCVCCLPRSPLVLAGDMNSNITVYDSSQRWNPIAACKGHSRSVWALCYVRDADRVASGSADLTIRIWNPHTWDCERVLDDHRGWVVSLSCGPSWMLSCSIDQTVRVWNVNFWCLERTFSDQLYEVYSVCAFAGGRFAVAGAEMSIVVYGAGKGKATSYTHLRESIPLDANKPSMPQEGMQVGGVLESGNSGDGILSWLSWLGQGGAPQPDDAARGGNARAETMSSATYAESPPKSSTFPQPAGGYNSRTALPQPSSSRNVSRVVGFDASADPRERRAKLMAHSSLDITMSNFRQQLQQVPSNRFADDDLDNSFGAHPSHGVRTIATLSSRPQAERHTASKQTPDIDDDPLGFETAHCVKRVDVDRLREELCQSHPISPSKVDDDPLDFETRKCVPRVDVERLRGSREAALAEIEQSVSDWSTRVGRRPS